MTSTDRSIELFVRSLTSSGIVYKQETVLDTLDRLDDRGVVDHYDVTVWGDQVVPGSIAAQTDTGEEILDAIDAFHSWAAENDVTVDRFFTDRAVTSSITGDPVTAISLPVIAMAEYEDGQLVSVTPHETEEDIQTVIDRLDALKDQATPASESTATPVA